MIPGTRQDRQPKAALTPEDETAADREIQRLIEEELLSRVVLRTQMSAYHPMQSSRDLL